MAEEAEQGRATEPLQDPQAYYSLLKPRRQQRPSGRGQSLPVTVSCTYPSSRHCPEERCQIYQRK